MLLKLVPVNSSFFELTMRGERVPLTIADFDRENGTITCIFQEVGYTTKQLATFEVGDHLATFVGPLGQPSEIDNYGTVVLVGGGVGVAPISQLLVH